MLLLPGKVTSQFSTICLQNSSPEADFLLNFSHLLLWKVVDPASRQHIVLHEEYEEQDEDEDRQCQGGQATSHRQSQVLLICWLFFNFNCLNFSSAAYISTSHRQVVLQLFISKVFFNFSSASWEFQKLLSLLLLLINLSSSLNGKHYCSEWPQNCSLGLTTSLEELQKLIKIVKRLLDVFPQ